MARQTRSTGTTDIELFLDMLAAERGAGPNTLTAYARDLELRWSAVRDKRIVKSEDPAGDGWSAPHPDGND